jgi:DNA-directed RNA polymerase subunit F
MQNRVVEMKPVSLCEVKDILKERKDEKELNYEQDMAFKYCEKFAKLTEKQTKDIVEGLKEISFLKDNELLRYQILYLLPTRAEHISLVLPKGVTATEDEIKAILDLTKKFEEKLK